MNDASDDSFARFFTPIFPDLLYVQFLTSFYLYFFI